MKRRLTLAIDQGGHSSRALLFDSRGAVVAQGRRPVATFHPHPGWVEHDAEALVASVRGAVADALAAAGARREEVVAAGLACQRASVVCWDRETGAPLSPVVSWQDRRNTRWLERLAPHAGEIATRTGLRLSPHYGASKLRWCLDHLPEVARAAERGRLAFGPLAAFLLVRLSGERTPRIDPANASRTLLWNLEGQRWDEPLIERFGLPREALPEPAASRDRFGRLHFEDGTSGPPLTVSSGDQGAALFARGAPEQEAAYVTFGTGAFVQRPCPDAPLRACGLLSSVVHIEPEQRWFSLEGTINGAASALRWLERHEGIEAPERHLAGWMERIEAPPLFLNGVGGLGAPFWQDDAPCRFIGDGGPQARAVAVVESVLFLVAEILERGKEALPPPRRLIVGGGLSKLDPLCQRLADLCAIPVERDASPETTARGLAMLVADPEPPWSPPPARTFEPRPAGALQERYRRWREALEAALRREPSGQE